MASASCEIAQDDTFDFTDIERIELPEIDCALLTTLLEESQAEGDVEHPGFSPQSPAATASSVGLYGDCDECGLEDMLSDALDALDASASTRMHVDDPFGWVDMDVVVPSSPIDDMGEWFMSTGEVGMLDYEHSEDYDQLYSYCCGAVPMEDGYSPLWQ